MKAYLTPRLKRLSRLLPVEVEVDRMPELAGEIEALRSMLIEVEGDLNAFRSV